MYFEYDDVEQVVKKMKKEKVTFVHESREQPWRQKVIRFYDPDENIIEVGETMEFLAFRLHKEGRDNEERSMTINMPVSFIKKSIEKFNHRD